MPSESGEAAKIKRYYVLSMLFAWMSPFDVVDDALCLSEIKSGHIDGVGRRELASLRCTRRHGQIA